MNINYFTSNGNNTATWSFLKRASVVILLLPLNSALAQESQDRQDLQESVELLSGVLEDALGFDQSQNFFGSLRGEIKHTYLYDQGVLIDIRTPLSSQRNRLGLSSLSLTMQSLGSLSGSGFVEPPVPPVPPQLALDQNRVGQTDNQLGQPFADFMSNFSELDLSGVVRDATLRASASARSLRSLGEVDQESYQSLREEIENIHSRLAEQMEEHAEIQQEVSEVINQQMERLAETTSTIDFSAIEQRLESVSTSAEELRLQALGKASELSEQLKSARDNASEQWQQDVKGLETKLYGVMCDYGASLKSLPDNESVTVLLRGLGDEGAGENSERLPDKIHVFNMTDLLACQRGELAAQDLSTRANQYSY